MSKALVPVKAHATLGASTASRWMACPGSVRLTRDIPNITTDAAREGTAAHALAQLALENSQDPILWLGQKLEGWEVDTEMVEHVRDFVAFVRERIALASEFGIEEKFSLAPLNPPEAMFGTTDVWTYDADARTLDVIDLKYGRGIVVEAVGNKQLRYYALGAALKLGAGRQIEKVRMTIFQPRAAHSDGPVREDEITIEELLGFAGELMDAAEATQDPNAPLVAGDHCRFCPIAARCPAQQALAQQVAQVVFADMPISTPPVPEALTVEQMAEMLPHLPTLEAWIKSMRAHAQRELENGATVPGFKLVQRRPTRRWVSDADTQLWLQEQGVEPNDFLEAPKLKSPAQIEKVLKTVGADRLDDTLVSKVSSGVTIAPLTDPRPPAMVSAVDAFDALPAIAEERD
jgi:hypothetical protein